MRKLLALIMPAKKIFCLFVLSCLYMSCMDKSPVDGVLLLKGGLIADGETATEEVGDVLIVGDRIKAVGKDLVSDGATVIDCNGMVVMPGFVDSHVHVESSMVLPVAFGEAVLPFGTTAVIADPHEIVNVAGSDGVCFFLENAAQSPSMSMLSFHQVSQQRRSTRMVAGSSWPGTWQAL